MLNVFVGHNGAGKTSILNAIEEQHNCEKLNAEITYESDDISGEIPFVSIHEESKLNLRLINVKNLLTIEKIRSSSLHSILIELSGNHVNDWDIVRCSNGVRKLLNIVHLLVIDKPKIVLLHYPEAGIHSDYHSLIGNLIQCASENGIQVFVTTYSNVILNCVKNANSIFGCRSI